MKFAHASVAGFEKARQTAAWMTMLLTVLLVSACGGGATTSEETPVAALECDPSDAATLAECGTLMLALTDADGDFLNYTVDVLSLTLETANGRIVETLPRSTRINFSDYVDLSELVSVANVPPATYVAGTIRLDYADAEVFVEADGAAKAASVVDADSNPLTQTELRIRLSNRQQLTIVRGRAALLQLDFDLDASHSVDIVPTPALAFADPFIIAEIDPVDEKDIRVRGPVVAVSEVDMNYTVAIRPFHDRDGDFGRATVQVTDDTEFEVDDVMYTGLEGLRALNAAGQGTPSVAQGTLDVEEREFTANIVLAGDSVPGAGLDAVKGNVVARSGNTLTVRGATIIASDRRAHFHDNVTVAIGPDTRVFKDGSGGTNVSIDDLSVGQRVTVRGTILEASTDAFSDAITFDATAGAVRMRLTRLLGMVNTVVPGQTDITLHAIDRRRVGLFDFSGTGTSPIDDADPDNYEVATSNLVLPNFSAGKPIVAYGFPTAFGMSPPDFSGRTVIDYMNVRSALGVGWGSDGTTMPFSAVNADSLLLNNQNPDIDQRRFVKQGPILIDLTTLPADTLIVPRETGRQLYYIKSADSLRQYSMFADFAADLSNSLDGATAARSMHARGLYDADSNTFTAYKIGLLLLEP